MESLRLEPDSRHRSWPNDVVFHQRPIDVGSDRRSPHHVRRSRSALNPTGRPRRQRRLIPKSLVEEPAMKHSSSALGILFALVMSGAPNGQQPTDQWPSYQHNSDFSPLTQITPANVKNLAPAWTFNYGAGSSNAGFVGLDYRFEVQPLLIGGVMYISTPASQTDAALKSTVTALEPETGKVIWQYTSPKRIHGRGLAYWPGDGSVGPRLYFGTDLGCLRAVALKTGQAVSSFGANGEVDVYSGVVSPEVGERRRSTFTVPTPAAVYESTVMA